MTKRRCVGEGWHYAMSARPIVVPLKFLHALSVVCCLLSIASIWDFVGRCMQVNVTRFPSINGLLGRK